MSAVDFINKYRLGPDSIDVGSVSEIMLSQCSEGLNSSDSTVPMIPTYLKISGNVTVDKPVIVIDAGGTNFRSAVVTMKENSYEISHLNVKKMPGIQTSSSWEDFISFVADEIEPLLAYSSIIGFCFSYNAIVTSDIDAVVVAIDKEVKIHDSEGRLVGLSLVNELSRRGHSGIRSFIINDTAAVLLGGYSGVNTAQFSGFIGQVSGTGTNTCCVIPSDRITKLSINEAYPMIINMESGMYDCVKNCELDDRLDESTDSKGFKRFEKMTAGVYLGALCRVAFRQAAADDILTQEELKNIDLLGDFDTSLVDKWASGEQLEYITDNPEHCDFIRNVCKAVILRSAKLMASNILAIMKLTDTGNNQDKPVCVFAEGSLVQKSKTYYDYYSFLLSEYLRKDFGKYTCLVLSNESTFPGSAAAALLNC